MKRGAILVARDLVVLGFLACAVAHGQQTRTDGTIRVSGPDLVVRFPSNYPAPAHDKKEVVRGGKPLDAGTYSTSNVQNGTVAFDGPNVKQFFLMYTECPQALGCSFSEEIEQFVSAQAQKGAEIRSRRKVSLSGFVGTEIVFYREIQGRPFFVRSFLFPHLEFVIGLTIQSQLLSDVNSPSANDFLASIKSVEPPSQAEQGQFFQSDDHRFSIIFPRGWQIQPGVTDQAVVKALHRDNRGRVAVVRIIVRKLKESPDLKMIKPETLFEFLNSEFSDTRRMVLQDSGRCTISGVDCIWLKIDIQQPLILAAFERTYVFVHKGKLVLVTASTMRESEHHNLFRETLEDTVNSLRFF